MNKRVIIDNIETDYLIYDDGRLFSLKTNKFLKGDTSSGYVRYLLCLENKRVRVPAHTLVARAFISNPNNLPIVDHKDNNKLNNNVNNLTWISYSDNVKKERRSKHPKIIINFNNEELLNEEWRQFRDTKYSFSSLGRMRNDKTNIIIHGHVNPVLIYIRDTIYLNNGVTLTLPRHRMVYEAFHPNEKLNIINHKDGDRTNNRLNNLENISASENLQKAYIETKTRRVRHCCCEKNGIKLAFWSISDAAAILKINESQIRQAMNRNGHTHNYKCYEITEEEYSQIVKSSETIEKVTNEKNISEN